jgi:hypothetical protein
LHAGRPVEAFDLALLARLAPVRRRNATLALVLARRDDQLPAEESQSLLRRTGHVLPFKARRTPRCQPGEPILPTKAGVVVAFHPKK